MTWILVWEVARFIIPAAGVAVAWWIGDRRKDSAAASVAEKTVGPTVEMSELGAAEARSIYVQRRMDEERSFHKEQLKDRDQEIHRLREENRMKDELLGHQGEVIHTLRVEAEDLRDQLTSATRQLSSVMERLDRLSSDNGNGHTT